MQKKKIAIFQFRDAYLRSNEQNAFSSRLGIQKNHLRFVDGQGETIAYPDIESLSAVILAGNGDESLSHEKTWLAGLHEYLDAVIKENIPTLGICFGHQILAKLFKADVVCDKKQRELGTISVSLTESGITDPLFKNLPVTFNSIAGHNDSVINLPDTLHILASNTTCPIQAFRLDSRPIYGLQFHPELDQNDYRARMEYYRDYYTRSGSDFIQTLEKGSYPTNDHAILKNFLSIVEAVNPGSIEAEEFISDALSEPSDA